MRHTRAEVVKRITREFNQLDRLVSHLTDEQWDLPVPRPETKEPWTVKDALAHITHWKADTLRKVRHQPVPPEERGLNINDGNHLIFVRWHDRPPREVLAWHRQVQADLLAALREAPQSYFNGKEHDEQWPFDVDGHSTYHRVKDIEGALRK
jgi:hypothetical protein